MTVINLVEDIFEASDLSRDWPEYRSRADAIDAQIAADKAEIERLRELMEWRPIASNPDRMGLCMLWLTSFGGETIVGFPAHYPTATHWKPLGDPPT